MGGGAIEPFTMSIYFFLYPSGYCKSVSIEERQIHLLIYEGGIFHFSSTIALSTWVQTNTTRATTMDGQHCDGQGVVVTYYY